MPSSVYLCSQNMNFTISYEYEYYILLKRQWAVGKKYKKYDCSFISNQNITIQKHYFFIKCLINFKTRDLFVKQLTAYLKILSTNF